MSHIVKVAVEVTDLVALQRAAVRCGGTLDVDQRTFKHYYSRPGKCDAAIKFPGCSYEVGVSKLIGRAQESYELSWDPYEQSLLKAMGYDGQKLVEAYSIETAIAAMAEQGASLLSETVREDGTVELQFVEAGS